MIQFRVRPTPRARCYAVVTLLPTKHAFTTYVRARGRTCGRDAAAVNMGRTGLSDYPDGHPRAFAEIATSVAFMRRKGVTVIAHEFAHTAFSYANARGFRGALGQSQPAAPGRSGEAGYMMARQSAEERYCYAIGFMASQAVKHLYAAKVFGDQ